MVKYSIGTPLATLVLPLLITKVMKNRNIVIEKQCLCYFEYSDSTVKWSTVIIKSFEHPNFQTFSKSYLA